MELGRPPRRIPSGVPGLDELIEGGFPARRVILVAGGPGSGKTVLSTHFIMAGASNFNERGLYVSLEEKREDFLREMMEFGWDMAAMERKELFRFIDATPRLPSKRGRSRVVSRFGGAETPGLLDLIGKSIEEMKPARLVIDPIASLSFEYPDLVERRDVVLTLVELLASSGATCLITNELRGVSVDREVQLEEYLAHGVVLLQAFPRGRAMVRALTVEKMRETEVDPQPRPYRIGAKGIEVFPKESIL